MISILILIIISLFLVLIVYNETFQEEQKPTDIERMKKIEHTFYGSIYVYDKDSISVSVMDGNSIWEEDVCKKMAEYYIDGTDFVDIGANLGLVTLGLNNYKKITGNAHCFEPQPDVFTMLKYNTRNLNTKLYNMALSDQYRLLSFTADDNAGLTVVKSGEERNEVNIIGMRLDDIKFDNRVSLVKMDAEGYEGEILLGAKQFLDTNKPILCIEMWEKNKERMTALLNELNYELVISTGIDDYIFKHRGDS
jgi:FkbM family methyltransferase